MIARTPDPDEDVSAHIWRTRYRHDGDASPDDSFRRVARALASAEVEHVEYWQETYARLMHAGRFLPGGRILAGAGTGRRVTLFNCFVMGTIEDSIDGIFRALREGAVTMQQGGGVGYDFSTLRPKGMPARRAGAIASGPVSFMHVFDRMCGTMLSTGTRRGAMMATLRCDHPDIEAFIDAKRDPGVLSYFNLSVLVTDDFLAAVRNDADWPLVFPGGDAGAGTVTRAWPGQDGPVACTVHRSVRARALWDRLMRAAYDSAEPGVLFIDRINAGNNLHYCEEIHATNPCGEVPLPPYGACDLGSLNLSAFVRDPFSASARLDETALGETTRIAVRMLDTVIDASRFPLAAQRRQAHASRRVGLGIMGLADALVMLGLRYDSEEARALARHAMRTICHEAYRTSIDLAQEKGPFPLFDRDAYLAAPFIAALPDEVRDGIARHGIRNSHLLAIAPTGTISLLAGQVSSGLEPPLAPVVERSILQSDGTWRKFTVTAASVQHWQALGKSGLPPAFLGAEDIAPEAQLAMQAALQSYVDNAISKTLAVPEKLSFEAFSQLYEKADALGLKGCTAFRPCGSRGCLAKPAKQDQSD